MTFRLALILAAAGLAVASTAALANSPAPAGANGQPFWAGVEWDDDDDDRRRLGAMPLPNAELLKRAGIVRVKEVERDDGRIEVEGVDRNGRELKVYMDARGQRVLNVRRDD